MLYRKIWWNEENSSYYAGSISGTKITVSQIVYVSEKGDNDLSCNNEQLGISVRNISSGTFSDRSLIFDGFYGDFNASGIVNIDTLNFETNSKRFSIRGTGYFFQRQVDEYRL